MKFIYGKNDWKDLGRGQENCYLLTNGLGGYSSMTMVGSVARNDHALFMSCTKAPNHRYHMITRLDETIQMEESEYNLSCQEYVNHVKNKTGYCYLQQFSFQDHPVWIYQAEGIEIKKTIVMKHGENTLGIRYEINNRMEIPAKLLVIPQLQFVAKGEAMEKGQTFLTSEGKILSNSLTLYYKTNADIENYDTQYEEDLYYAYDARDGRDAVGKTAHNHRLSFNIQAKQEEVFWIIYSTNAIGELTLNQMLKLEENRQKELVRQSQITDETGIQLVKSADQFVANRESTEGKSIMAGYPFFADWGRDTMIAMVGCCISTRRFEDSKSIFRTFMKYCDKGLMPNMFPEGGNDPIYNTVDASLLFIGAVYEYYLESGDLAFVKEAFPVMKDIIGWYQKGTDFHIRMDQDGLIEAGSGLEQVTWMDVRFEDILPTPRHGKPVEINAYWYNDLMILGYFSKLLGNEDKQYELLADQVKKSFCEQFWNEKQGCLKDIVSGGKADEQIRCNQIWAVSQPFTMLNREQEKQVVDKVFEKLYTPYGLRTLNKEDKDYKPVYGGSHFNRDMAYHQGTVWPFPMGAYYLAYLKVNDDSESAVCKVKEQLEVMQACMREGCIGQIAEIYDGENPTISQGCFAQAWSVSEILRVYAKLQKITK
ncbi:MAG TPA: amylo-alpha-1,6-glucosidase [Mobilitalea sp.]|nr:amylo-alpha-1,6-glucosidase [Mobilitalea sp.]